MTVCGLAILIRARYTRTHTDIYMHIYIYMLIHMYVYILMRVCLPVCICIVTGCYDCGEQVWE
jgi:hypothetical protein